MGMPVALPFQGVFPSQVSGFLYVVFSGGPAGSGICERPGEKGDLTWDGLRDSQWRFRRSRQGIACNNC